MPIVEINAIAPADDSVIPRILADVRKAGAQAMQCDPGNVWVVFHALPYGSYLRGVEPAQRPQPASHPPYVIVKAQSGRSREEQRAFIKAISDVLGDALSLPAQDIWVHYQEMKPEDVWTGGR